MIIGSAGTVLSAGAALAKAPPREAPGALCAQAITTAERQAKLPGGLLRAIGLVESGRAGVAGTAEVSWPWTIHVGDEGRFYATKGDAIAAVTALEASGVRSIDIGCMQINLLQHPKAFASLDQAFDPSANALFAAHFLRELFVRTGSWPAAAAAYHSRNTTLALAYRERVMARWGRRMAGLAWPTVGIHYAAFAPPETTYRAFAPSTQMFGAFARLASYPALALKRTRHARPSPTRMPVPGIKEAAARVRGTRTP